MGMFHGKIGITCTSGWDKGGLPDVPEGNCNSESSFVSVNPYSYRDKEVSQLEAPFLVEGPWCVGEYEIVLL